MADTPRRRQGAHFSSSQGDQERSRARRAAGQGASASRPSAHASGATGPRRVARRNATVPTGRVSNRAARMTTAATPRTRAQRAASARGGHSSAAPVIGVLAALAVVGVLFVTLVLPRFGASDESDKGTVAQTGSQVQLTIPDGSGAAAIGQALQQAGLIENAGDFVTAVQQKKADSALKSGTYVFTAGSDMDAIIDLLESGSNYTGARVTIPEGYTVARIAEAVEGSLGISKDDFLAQAKASNYASDYDFLAGVQDDSLEGFLFPKTYDFADQGDASADTVIRAMLDQFAGELATLDLSFPEGRGLSTAELVNLASIVEKESTPQTRPKVASVFYNRLGNMGDPNYGFLQSDATTAYSVGHDPSADEVHSETDPYSTYTNQGLPPTPICSPGLESLQAVCSPDMDAINEGYFYFYFWNDENGQVQYAFSKTYEEHQGAIAQNR